MDVPGRMGQITVEVGSNFGTLVVGEHNIVQVSGATAPVISAHTPAAVHRPPTPAGFLDRRAETLKVASQLVAGSVVEVIGPPAVGKTSFIRHIAELQAGRFADGALELPPGLAGAQDVLQAVFEMFYDVTPPLVPSVVRLRELLASKNALLLVDDSALPQAAVRPLLDVLRQSALLVTADVPALGPGVSLQLPLAGLPTDDALALVERVHGAPLAGPLAAQALAGVEAEAGHPGRVIEAARRLAAGTPPAGIEAATDALAPKARDALAMLLAFAPQPVSEGVLADLTGIDSASAALRQLAAAGLVETAAAAEATGGADESRWTLASAARALAARSGPDAARAQRVAALERMARQPVAPGDRRRASRLLAALPLLWHALAEAHGAGAARQVMTLGLAWHGVLALHARWDGLAVLMRAHEQAARSVGDMAAAAWAVHQAGTRAFALGQFAEAGEAFRQSLQMSADGVDTVMHAASEQQMQALRPFLAGGASAPAPSSPAPPAPPALPRVSAGTTTAKVGGMLAGAKAIVGGLALAVAGGGGWWWWSAPKLAVERAQLQFEPVVLSTAGAEPATQVVRLRNHGQRAGTLTSAALEGGDGAFQIESGSACIGTPLAGGQSCELRVRFKPSRAGVASAQLVAGGAEIGSVQVALNGTARAGSLAVAPGDRLDFGSMELGGDEPRRTLTLRNDGDAPLRVQPLRGVTAPFALVTDGCGGKALAPGEECRIELRFKAAQAAPAEAALTLASDAFGAADRRVVLQGQGRAGRMEIQPLRLAFGALDAGASSDTQMLRLHNAGDAPLRLTAPQLEPSGAPFTIDATACLREPVPPGADCAVAVRFQARPPRGAREARLRLAAGQSAPATVALSGQVRLGELVVEPAAALDFGRVETSGRRLAAADAGAAGSATRRVRLLNRGDAVLRLGAAQLAGPRTADFRIEASTCGDELAPGAACELTLRFLPAAAGRSQAELTLPSPTSGVSGAAIELSGEAVQRAPARLEAARLRLPEAGETRTCERGARTVQVVFAWDAPAGAPTGTSYKLMAEPGGELASGGASRASAQLPCVNRQVSWWVEAQAGGLASRSESRRLQVQVPAAPPPVTPPSTFTPSPAIITPPVFTRPPVATRPPAETAPPAAKTPPAATATPPSTSATARPGTAVRPSTSATTAPPATQPATTVSPTLRALESSRARTVVSPMGKCCARSSGPPVDARKNDCLPPATWYETSKAPSFCGPVIK